jgi:hypothetical protein
LARAPDEQVLKPRGWMLDRVNRRRASPLARVLADVHAEAVADAGLDPSAVQTVIGSSIAEASTLLGMLDQIWRRREPMSPAAFTMSVHNAASGLISIASHNRTFTTSIASDEDTPAAALLEAVGLVLANGQPVGVACGDEAAPPDLVPQDEAWDMLAAAIVLAPPDHPGPCRATLTLSGPSAPCLAPAAIAPALARNPQAGLVDLVDAVSRGGGGTVRLDRGRGRGYCAFIEPLGAGRGPGDGPSQ